MDYWKDANERIDLINPKPFNCISRAEISAQASSASAEHLLSGVGGNEGFQRQSLLSGTLEMTEVIRGCVVSDIAALQRPQHTLFHPEADAYRRAIVKVTQWIEKE